MSLILRKTRLVDLLGLEHVLHDLEIGEKFVFMFRVELDAIHGEIAFRIAGYGRQRSSGRQKEEFLKLETRQAIRDTVNVP